MKSAIVKKLKENDQDFEWYPTTKQIIEMVKKRIDKSDSVMDCGAGDGRVLDQLTNSHKYAIEKSRLLIQEMANDVVIVGTDFFQSTLIDKEVNIIFSNPPYSQYEDWAVKIITEGHAKKVFLVIPTRWNESGKIKEALEKREAKAEILGTFDFLNAERKARAEVNLLQIKLGNSSYYERAQNVDPFDLWFDTEFDFEEATDDDIDNHAKDRQTLKEKTEKAVVDGKGKVPAMVELYNHEMGHLYDNFKKLSALDADLLKELGASKESIREAIKQRIAGLKNKYWNELFDNLSDITSRLTKKSRKKMLNRLTSQTNIDFTESNIYAVLIWVIKNANQYYDDQLIEVFKSMTKEANVFNYKSNKKVWVDNRWRCQEGEVKNSHYGLELRIVLDRYRAIFNNGYSWEHPNNLHNDAHDFINDLLTIANNLNFTINEDSKNIIDAGVRQSRGEWESNKSQMFHYDTDKDLMSIKAFKNGNLHIKFNQKFIRRLNVEFGRLCGWIRNTKEAARELNIPLKDAKESFNSNRQLIASNVKLLSK